MTHRFNDTNELKVKAEVGGSGVWAVGRCDCCGRETTWGVDLATLNIPTDLMARFDAWMTYHDNAFSAYLEQGACEAPRGFDGEWLLTEGRALADELRRVLGRDRVVRYAHDEER